MKKLFYISVFTVTLVFPSCNGKQGSENKEELGGSVQVDGSSTVYPITEAIAEEFMKENKKVKATIGVSGTGGGFKKFIRNEIDIADASRPIKKGEDSACAAGGIEYLELPIAFDGLAVVVNPQNTWVNDITVAELKKLWEPEAQGKINNAITDLENAIKGEDPAPIKAAIDVLNRAWSEASSAMYQNAGAQPGAGASDGQAGPPPSQNGQSADGSKVENADFEVVDDEKK